MLLLFANKQNCPGVSFASMTERCHFWPNIWAAVEHQYDNGMHEMKTLFNRHIYLLEYDDADM